MSTSAPTSELTSLPTGTWSVDPSKSTVGFKARGMFGLVPVSGTFSEHKGTLTVDADGAWGELRIAAASLDTGNAKRDEHLRSEDFFDVEKTPTIVFALSSVTTGGGGSDLTLSGELKIGTSRMQLSVPVSAVLLGMDRLQLSTKVSVDRTEAGVGWSKMGMIQGKAHLHGVLELTRA